MIEFLTYDLKVAVLLAVFYMFYRLMLARETFHRVNRVVLLLTAVASFVLPLCVITTHETVTMELPMAMTDLQYDEMGYSAMAEMESEAVPVWQIVLPIIFMVGMLSALAHTLWSLLRIVSLIAKSEKHPQDDGTVICVTGNADMAPFSWMCFIVMNRSDYDEQNAAILTHERGHIRLHHSWDLLLVDTLTALQWFNPAIWMLRSDLRAIHEYEADGEVLSQGINARQYQYLLITKAASIGGYSLANGISHSTLKNRINMMLHTKSPRRSLLKLLALLPIVAVTLAVNAETVTDYVYNEPQTPVKKGNKAGVINLGAGKKIVVEKADDAKAEANMPADLEQFTVSGTVYDGSAATKSPIIGAIVKIVGSKKGTVTDMDGNFRLEVTAGDRIEVIYMGFEPFTIGVSKVYSERNDYKIMLQKEGTNRDTNKPYDVVEVMPQFPGGTGKLFEFLSMSVKYPAEAEKNDVQGRVIVTFVVEKDGEVSNAKVVKSVHPALDAEALRVINAMPKWTPGMQNGEAVRVKYTVPVTFRLQGKDSNIGNAKADIDKGANVLSEMVVVGFGKQDEAAKHPLYVVDGVTMDYEKVKGISPDNITGMEVLKDKAAIDKYGEKAKNGVVVIHTKKK